MLLGIDAPLPDDIFPEIQGRFESDADGHPGEQLVIVRDGDYPEERFIISPYHGIREVVQRDQREGLSNVCFAPFAATRHRDGQVYVHGSSCLRVDVSLWNSDDVLRRQQPLAVRVDELDQPGRWAHEVGGSKARFVRGPEAAAKIRRALVGYLKANTAFLHSPQINAAIEATLRDGGTA